MNEEENASGSLGLEGGSRGDPRRTLYLSANRLTQH